MPSDPHKPLRDDVRLLGDLLGDTLRAQAGEKVFRTVERVRALAKSARAGRDADFTALAAELSRMPVDDAAAGGARVRALPPPGQHRRAASSHSPPPRLPARSRARAAARIVRRRVRAAARRRRHRQIGCTRRCCALQIELVLDRASRPKWRAARSCRSTTASPRALARAIGLDLTAPRARRAGGRAPARDR